jgi:two-component system response regulator LytT
MNILIVEDERRVARQLEKMIRQIIGRQIQQLWIADELEEAQKLIKEQAVELLFLDLNLHGEDGFELLRHSAATAFNTIITSAYQSKAIEAFDFGVIDFVPKPFVKERLEKAIQRHLAQPSGQDIRYLLVKKVLNNRIIDCSQVVCVEARGKHCCLKLLSEEEEIHHKSLDQMMQSLPPSFERVHRSYIANMDLVEQLNILPGSKYVLVMKNNGKVPVGRVHYKRLKNRFI